MLVVQNAGNVWRKRAYRELLALDAAAIAGGGARMARFSTALLAWKEETDSKVERIQWREHLA